MVRWLYYMQVGADAASISISPRDVVFLGSFDFVSSHDLNQVNYHEAHEECQRREKKAKIPFRSIAQTGFIPNRSLKPDKYCAFVYEMRMIEWH